jgi:copper homeostasis protein (lipoprotein)
MRLLQNARIMRSRIINILVFTVAGLGSCKQHSGKAVGKTDSPLVRTDTQIVVADTVIRYRSYSGVLPCSNCEGIQVTINLMGDYSYQELSNRLGKRGKKIGETIDETGRWMLHGRDTVQLLDVTDGPSKYLKTDTSLIQLDAAGERMTGMLASQYELKKIK